MSGRADAATVGMFATSAAASVKEMQTSAERNCSPSELGGTTFRSMSAISSSLRVFPIADSPSAATAPVIVNLSAGASLMIVPPILPVAPTTQRRRGLVAGICQALPVLGHLQPIGYRDVEGPLYGLEDLRVDGPDSPQRL